MLHTIALESRYTDFASYGNILRLKHEVVCNSVLCDIYVSTFPLTLPLLLETNHCMTITLLRSSTIFLRHVHEFTSNCMYLADRSTTTDRAT